MLLVNGVVLLVNGKHVLLLPAAAGVAAVPKIPLGYRAFYYSSSSAVCEATQQGKGCAHEQVVADWEWAKGKAAQQ